MGFAGGATCRATLWLLPAASTSPRTTTCTDAQLRPRHPRRHCCAATAAASASPVQHIHLCQEHGINNLLLYVVHREPVARCVQHQAAVPKARLVRHCASGGMQVQMETQVKV